MSWLSTVVCGLLALSLALPGKVHAEGSAQIGLNQALVDFSAGLLRLAPDAQASSIFIDVNAGEFINIALCGQNQTDDIQISVYDETADPLANNPTPVFQTTLTEGNVSCNDPMTGNLTNPVRVPVTSTGRWFMRLENLTGASFNTTEFRRYDFYVAPNNTAPSVPTEIQGRVHAFSWNLNGGGFGIANATNTNYYTLVPGGRPNTNYVWLLDLNLFAGNGYAIRANAIGVEPPFSGFSVPIAGNSALPEFPIYLNPPAVAQPRPTLAPQIVNARFEDNQGEDNTISPGNTPGVQDDGEFIFETDVTGNFAIRVDVNRNGVFGDIGDTRLIGRSVVGENRVFWNGTDPNGQVLDLGTYQVEVSIRLGEYHFIADDVETSGGPNNNGFTIFELLENGSTASTLVFWDDATVLRNPTGNSTTPQGALSGTPAGFHTWGNFSISGFGNERFIDTFVFGLNSREQIEIQITRAEGPDFDGDGIEDVIDIDDDDDGILDTVEGDGSRDSDGDGQPDSLDIDSDNDGIPDNVEGQLEPVTGGGSYVPPSGADADNDGLDNAYDRDFAGQRGTLTPITPFNTDGVDLPDYLDPDSDNDTVPDRIEGHDLNRNGISDAVEASADLLNDDDGDGLLNAYDNFDNTLPNRRGNNSIGSNAPLQDTDLATDPTGGRDWRDTDDDGDGLPTNSSGPGLEDANGNNDPTDDDDDADGTPNYLEPSDKDNDGVPDIIDIDDDDDGILDVVEDNGNVNRDSDGDGIVDRLDIDSDNDGILDNIEAQGEGAAYIPPQNADSDGDGLDNAYEGTGDTGLTPINTDLTDLPDYLDNDSDNDNVPDVIEGNDANTDGVNDANPAGLGVDTDNDGLQDAYDTNNILPVAGNNPVAANTALQNTDVILGLNPDGIRDWRDTDDDGDGFLTNGPFEDVNQNNNPVDDDDDNDGTPNYLQLNLDSDDDGIPDNTDIDDDNDGILDTREDNGDPNRDTDGDGVVDRLDIDSDNDGIADVIEAQAENAAFISPDGVDTNGDGLLDVYGPGLTPVDSEVDLLNNPTPDGTPDYLDDDSDNDNVPDRVEGHDPNTDGLANRGPILTFADADGDGMDDIYDSVPRPSILNPVGGFAELQNTDLDGRRDWRDPDDDADGFPTAGPAEDTDLNGDPTNDDSDGNGTPNYLQIDRDTDGDGVPDSTDIDDDDDGRLDVDEDAGDPNRDTDSDGVVDRLDIDSDDDGIVDNIELQSDANYRPPLNQDTDGDGLDDAYDPDNGGTPIGVPQNTDGVDTPDYLDTDSDNDGVPDRTEGNDANTDGQPDVLFSGNDTDGDGLDNVYDTVPGPNVSGNELGSNAPIQNTDQILGVDPDLLPDYRDTDDDGDGFLTNSPAEDTNRNGDATDDDGDNNGIPNYLQIDVDTDGDGVPDVTDIDDDDDGRLDNDEDNGDPNRDSDNDGIVDRLDIDSDNDGIVDNIEFQPDLGYRPPSNLDTDGDGLDDAYDTTNGGTPLGNPQNTDGVDNPDYLDLDSDNDGVPDLIEGSDNDRDGNADVTPTNNDADNDGLDDAFDIVNGSNISGNELGSNAPLQNTDQVLNNNPDILPDYRDTDDDGDSFLTSDFAEDTNRNGDPTDDDADNNLVPNYLQVDVDSDGDGVPDSTDIDDDDDGRLDVDEEGGNPARDTDNDGIVDRLDIDSDNDGIVDNIELQSDANYRPPLNRDTDGDGLDDAYDLNNGGTPLPNPQNTDGVDEPDYRDTDSDNDGVPDLIEGNDANTDGIADNPLTGNDADNDGLDDTFDTQPNAQAPGNELASRAPIQNTDVVLNNNPDIFPDYRDIDDDGDSFPTNGVAEDANQDGNPTNDDGDGNGTPNYLQADIDSDGDGIPDSTDIDDDDDGRLDVDEDNGDPLRDTDGDGVLDRLDIDSDNDGIVDNVELQPTNGYRPPLNVDTDGDGLDNAYDPDNGGTPIGTPQNTDGVDNPDYLDNDSDNDGVPDLIEGHDANTDGIGDSPLTGQDDDNDGLDNAFDVQPDRQQPGNEISSNAPLQNTDLVLNNNPDDLPDFRDTDDDGDGFPTAGFGEDVNRNGDPTDDDENNNGTPNYLEPNVDTDGDGVPDSADIDDDDDGRLDVDEDNGDPNRDSDGDGVVDRLDIDSDNDGIVDNIELQSDANYRPPVNADTDGDGLDDAYDADNGGTPLGAPENTDGTDNPDYLDDDSDNDNVPDLIEGNDANTDGIGDNPLTGLDDDNDGLDNIFDIVNGAAIPGNELGSDAPIQNTDAGLANGDLLPDYRDTDDDADGFATSGPQEDTNLNSDPTDDDADGNGIPNYLQSDIDTDGDGVPDSTDVDDDDDGRLDVDEDNGDPSRDSDGDGIVDRLDIDADNDGIVDNIELQSDANYRPPLNVDTDGDGLDDAYDLNNGGTPLGAPENTDLTDQPDYLDDDSDNDGVPDLIEGNDANLDGIADAALTGNDADGDGLDDAFDIVNGADVSGNELGSNAALQNTDVILNNNPDLLPDYRDTDDDGDGFLTTDLQEDTNGDGDPTNDDGDGDGNPNYLDLSLTVAGESWLDEDHDDTFQRQNEAPGESYTAQLLEDGTVIQAVPVDASGNFNFASFDRRAGRTYTVRVLHPTTNVQFGTVKTIDFSQPNALAVDLPIDPNGTVYNSDTRTPIEGVTATLLNDASGLELPAACVGFNQQNQVTAADGFYRFDVNLGADSACSSGDTYRLSFTPVGNQVFPSANIAPEGFAFDASGPAANFIVPTAGAPANGSPTTYHLTFILSSGDGDVVNNHVPIDPPVGEPTVRVIKTASKREALVGDLIRYTVSAENVGVVDIPSFDLTDILPAGFSYVERSLRVNGDATGFTQSVNGRALQIGGLPLAVGDTSTIEYILRVSAGVVRGDYVNSVTPSIAGAPIGNTATETVTIVADPDFEQTTIVGKVFDDRNGDGWQDPGEAGVPGVRIATLGGLLIETDQHGRYHVAGVDVDRFDRGRNFYLKVDAATLPSGTQFVSENPRIMRITQGLLNRFDFAVQLPEPARLAGGSRTVSVEIGKVFFDRASTTIRAQYLPMLDKLAERIEGYDGGVITITGHGGTEKLAIGRAIALRDALRERLPPGMIDSINIVVASETHGPLLTVGDTIKLGEVFFDTDKDYVKPKYRKLLQTIAEEMKGKCGRVISIEGNADKRLSRAYNYDLALRRAKNVRKALESMTSVKFKNCIDVEPTSRPRATPNRAPRGSGLMDTTSDTLVSQVAPQRSSADMRNHNPAQTAANPMTTNTKWWQHGLAAVLSVFVNTAEAQQAPAVATQQACDVDFCSTDEGFVIRVITNGEDVPRTKGNSPAALQDNRRVDIWMEGKDGEVEEGLSQEKRRADMTGRFRVAVPGGGIMWTTEDPAIAAPRLAASAAIGTIDANGGRSVNFAVYTNYPAFIKRLQLFVYRSSDIDQIDPVAVLKVPTAVLSEVQWDTSDLRHPLEDLVYVLKAHGHNGERDITRTQGFSLADAQPTEGVREVPSVVASVYGANHLTKQQIPVNGSRVRIYGQGIPAGQTLSIDGVELPVDTGDKFAVEYVLPVGQYRFDVELDNGTAKNSVTLGADVTGRYMFIAALADLTASQNNISGAVEILEADDRYEDDFRVDGRLAFYLKGKIKGKYLVTAQMDTQEREVDDLFDGFLDQDPASLFRRLDPDRYYPVYGDDSTTVSDVDTQGRLYVRVDWDKSHALWGNYNTNIIGNEFAQYNRGLYGGQVQHTSAATTTFDEAKTTFSAFVSEAQTALGHSEFLGTGGSLYFLRHTDILAGSDKLHVEIRDRDSDRTISSVQLVRGADYEIDEIQGRVILSKPLKQISRELTNSIVRDNALDGHNVILLADYEYLPRGFKEDHLASGGRAKQWIGDNVAIGGTYIDENRAGDDYQLRGIDLTFQAGRGTYLKLEHAESKSTQADRFFSDNGGLSFTQLSALGQTGVRGGDREGSAKSVEARINLQEQGITRGEWTVAAWWKEVEADFSVARRDGEGLKSEEHGMQTVGQITDRVRLTIDTSTVETGTTIQEDRYGARLDVDVGARGTVSVEARRLTSTDKDSPTTDTEETLAAVQYLHRVTDNLDIFAVYQDSLNSDFPDGPGLPADSGDQYTLGAIYRIGNATELGVEYTKGDFDEAVIASAAVQVGQGQSVYSEYRYSTDTTERGTSNQEIVVGSRMQVSNQTTVFAESSYGDGDAETGITHAFGLDFAPRPGWSVGLSVQSGDLQRASGPNVDRRATTLHGGYRSDRAQWSSKLEFREDEGAENIEQWLSTNRLNIKFNESWRLLSKLNYSVTEDQTSGGPRLNDAKLVEGSLGFAYRPVDNTRWNVLGKYTYLYDLRSSGQENAGTDQRSNILSLEGVYRLTSDWELSGKYAVRSGELRVGRDDGEWFESQVQLLVVRMRYNLMRAWDGLLEYRVLSVDEDGSERGGALIGIDRYLTENFRVGVGYSFADFSDDLRILDYDYEGWYVNFVGSY